MVAMKNEDIRDVLVAAREGPRNQVDLNLFFGWDYAYQSKVVEYCYDRGLIRAIELPHLKSPFREFIITGITADGLEFLNESSPLKRLARKSRLGVGIAAGMIAITVALVEIIASHNKVWTEVHSWVHSLIR